jgi:L-arabinose isomerase
MRFTPKIGFCVIYHPFEENAEKAPEIFKNSLLILKSLENFKIIPANDLIKDTTTGISIGNQFKNEQVDLICVKLATWSSDEAILEMSSSYNVPFIFWTYPHIHAGSLCGGQQFNMVFKELNKECIFVYKDDKSALNKIKTYAKCVALRNRLKTIRVGIIGKTTQGMTEVLYDKPSVKEILGPEVYNIGLNEFKELVGRISDEDANPKWQEIKGKVGKVSVKDSDGLNAIKNYFALKKIIESEKLSGVTIECYPSYMGELCLGFSILAYYGIACACEADINSTILMYILMNLTGEPVHNIDPLFLYEEDDSVLGSHCGCGSFELANSKENIELSNVRLAEKGLCVLFPSKPGKVTMVNLVGKKGTYRMTVCEGEAIETSMEFPGNPIRIKLPVSIEDYLEIIEEYGIGHHWIIAYGHYELELRRLASLLKIDFIKI